MDWIKAFFLGGIWAGSFFLMAYFAFQLFVFPLLLKAKPFWTKQVAQRIQKEPQAGERILKQSQKIMRILIAVFVLVSVTIFVYSFSAILLRYAFPAPPQHWSYFVVGTLPYATLALYYGIRYLVLQPSTHG